MLRANSLQNQLFGSLVYRVRPYQPGYCTRLSSESNSLHLEAILLPTSSRGVLRDVMASTPCKTTKWLCLFLLNLVTTPQKQPSHDLNVWQLGEGKHLKHISNKLTERQYIAKPFVENTKNPQLLKHHSALNKTYASPTLDKHNTLSHNQALSTQRALQRHMLGSFCNKLNSVT